MSNFKPPLLVIVGPTATGKSELAVKWAREHNGQVISADSRQIYRGLDIGSGQITEEDKQGVPHYGLDIADPRERFTVAEYKHYADHAIRQIHNSGRLPLLAGGTGFYIQAVVDDLNLPAVPPHPELREKLEQKSPEELYAELSRRDPRRARTVQRQNKRRLIRALEIVEARGAVPPLARRESPYDLRMVGLYREAEDLRRRIRERVRKRLEAGLIREARELWKKGVNLERLREIGLTYAVLADHLAGRLAASELPGAIEQAEYRYAKRQLTWFRRDPRIQWFRPEEDIPFPF